MVEEYNIGIGFEGITCENVNWNEIFQMGYSSRFRMTAVDLLT
jgi:hypothetical protein